MTLLDATATLIDFAKTNGIESDSHLLKAVKRMEKRLRLLQLRRAKTIRRNRQSAWDDCRLGLLARWSWQNPGKATAIKKQKLIEDPECHRCGFKFNFGLFLKNAVLDGRGKIKTLICPKCNELLIGSDPNMGITPGFFIRAGHKVLTNSKGRVNLSHK
jgi:hypothetical protein